MSGNSVWLSLAIAASVAVTPPFAAHAAIGDTPGGETKRETGAQESIAAGWGNGSVTAGELKEYVISKVGMEMRHRNEITRGGLRLLLEEIIGQKLLLRAARDRDLLVDPKFTHSYALASAKEVADRYVREVLGKTLAVPEKELAAALPKRKDVVRIKYIIVPTEEEAREVIERIGGGMPFDEAIERYSTVKTAPGAFLDVRDMEDTLDEEVRTRILDLSQGEISGVLPMKIGYGVVLPIEKRTMTGDELAYLSQEKGRALFQRNISRYVAGLYEEMGIELNEQELMLAAAEDFEFRKPHRPVLTVSGKPVFFDDYVRTRDVHLRDTMKARTPADLYSAYKVEFENVAITLALARDAASRKGWKEPEEAKQREIREKLAMRVLGENLFDGIEVTEKEIEKEYRGNKKAFTIKKRYKALQLTFSSRQEADRFRKTVSTPKEFFRQYRQRETKEDRFQNTFFEWKNDDSLKEETRKAFDKSGKGKLTEVITVGEGKHQVYLIEEVQKNYVIPYDQVRVNIKRGLLRHKQETALAKFVEGLRKKQTIRISEPVLDRVLADLNEKGHRTIPGKGGEGNKR